MHVTIARLTLKAFLQPSPGLHDCVVQPWVRVSIAKRQL